MSGANRFNSLVLTAGVYLSFSIFVPFIMMNPHKAILVYTLPHTLQPPTSTGASVVLDSPSTHIVVLKGKKLTPVV